MKPRGAQLIAEFIHCSSHILNDKQLLEKTLQRAIKKAGLHHKKIVSHCFYPVGVTTIAIISESHIAIHTYPEARHASIDIFTCSLNQKTQRQLLQFFKQKLKPRMVRFLEVVRGIPIEMRQQSWLSESTTRGWATRYYATKVLVSKKTRYQQIDIIENSDFGRMLFLDGDLQIAQKDAHLYNQSLVAPLAGNRKKLSTVAILGGGDGGVLHELLKLQPRSISIVDIDEEVIFYSRKFLHSINKNAFNDHRAKIVIDDAINFLKHHHGFDAIIYDLTMYPEFFSHRPRIVYLREMFLRIYQNLNRNGLLSFQCCSEFDSKTLKTIKRNLTKYFKDIRFNKVFISSFRENWIFASARKA